MSEEIVLTEHTITNILDTIRKPNGNKRKNDVLFSDIVPDVWKKLGLEGEPDQAKLENLLINLITSMYDIRVSDEAQRRDNARKRDFTLLMFGLLDGYYHTKENSGIKINVTQQQRYEMYLNDDHFVNLDYPSEGTYLEIKNKDKIKKPKRQNRPLNSLTGIVGDCKIEVANKLFGLIQNKSYKQYMEQVDLPEPYYTLEHFNPIIIGTEESIKQNRLKQLLCRLFPKGKRLFAAVVIVAVFLLIACCFLAFELLRLKTYENEEVSEAVAAAERTPPTSIEIKNKYIQLYPGDDDYLIVMVTPKEINIQDLDYTSSESSVVIADKNHITALYGWDENACHDIKITVQGGGAATAEAEVIVLKPKDLDGAGNASIGGGGYAHNGNME